MDDPNFVGASLPYFENLEKYNIVFECEEAVEPDTGIKIARIKNIEVLDMWGRDAEHKVDMEKVTRCCYNHASHVISNMTRS